MTGYESVLTAVQSVLTLRDTTVEDVTKSVPLNPKMVGAHGQKSATGPCSTIVTLTERDCYLIGHALNEVKMLTDVATEDPPEVLKRLVDVITMAKISEKGRRVVEGVPKI